MHQLRPTGRAPSLLLQGKGSHHANQTAQGKQPSLATAVVVSTIQTSADLERQNVGTATRRATSLQCAARNRKTPILNRVML